MITRLATCPLGWGLWSPTPWCSPWGRHRNLGWVLWWVPGAGCCLGPPGSLPVMVAGSCAHTNSAQQISQPGRATTQLVLAGALVTLGGGDPALGIQVCLSQSLSFSLTHTHTHTHSDLVISQQIKMAKRKMQLPF
jgi:hypothetical protein